MAFVRLIRQHILFIIVVCSLTVIMAYPTFSYMLDNTTIYISNDEDVFMKFWDAWYFGELIAGRADYYFASNLFYPQGVDLSYHSFNLVHMILMFIVKPFLGVFRAYHAVNLIIVMLTSLAGYVYLNFLLKDKYVSLLGAVLFGFTLQTLRYVAHPDLSLLATIPLALYFIERSMIERRWLFAIVAGVTVGITIFIGMYIYICLLIIAGLRILMLLLSASNYTDRKIWANLVLFAIVVGAISAIRIYPMIVNSDELQFVTQKEVDLTDTYTEERSDLLSYFVNYTNPLLESFDELLGPSFRKDGNFSYLGYTAIFLSIFGLLHKTYRPKMLFWLLIFAIFFVLRLGSILTFNGEVYTNIVLPKKFLNEYVPFIFSSFHVSGHFQMGIGLPLAIMASYGTLTLISYGERVPKVAVVLLLIGLAMFETYSPVESPPMPSEQLSFSNHLAMSDDATGALINLPMGRVESKLYEFYQTIHHLPQVEGLVSRTPSNAHDYIRHNSLLAAWQNNQYKSCVENFFYFYRDASKLRDDGFQFVVFHKMLFKEPVYDVFDHLEPDYEDDYVLVYELETLIADCPLDEVQPEFLGDSLGIHYKDNPLLILHNYIIEPIDDLIQILLLWERSGQAFDEQLSVSLQIFDEDKNKVQQQDYYLPLEPIDAKSISIANLEPGIYQVKLIVYNHKTGETQLAQHGDEDGEYREVTIYTIEIK